MRLIDVDALYDELLHDVNKTNNIDNRECDLFIEYLDAAPIVNRWIPVTDRMPEVLDSVIVHYGNGDIRETIFFPDGGFIHEHHYGGVTHWMPLQEPPVSEDA